MKYEAVIFDLDGVICETDMCHYQAWKKIADRIGVEFNEEINHRLRGVSRMESLEIILEKYDGHLSDEEKETLTAEKNEIYRAKIKEATPDIIIDGVEEILSFLRESKIKIGLSSASKNAKLILSRIGLIDAFDVIVDGNDITKAKPDPQGFLKTAEHLGVSPARSLVVEDSEAGVVAAHAGGMDVAFVSTGCKSSIADYSIESVSELKDIVVRTAAL
ncbi:MAG: beta-phosphoglucomutase [Lentihominibacter sp.]|jgi:beta-phosphoglucomutase